MELTANEKLFLSMLIKMSEIIIDQNGSFLLSNGNYFDNNNLYFLTAKLDLTDEVY